MAVWSTLPRSQVATCARLDAEYFRPDYLALREALCGLGAVPVESFAYVTDGIHASPDVVEEAGIKYLSAKSVKDNRFALGDGLRISRAQHEANKRTQLKPDDVLITTVGTIGNAAVVTPDLLPANADRHLGIIRILSDADLDPYYLATFLNSRPGREQSLREATGNVQLNLFIEKIKTLKVVRLAEHDEIANLTRRAYRRQKEADRLLRKAEEAIDKALGFAKLDPSRRLSYVRAFSDTQKAGRLDPEFFSPRFTEFNDQMVRACEERQWELVVLETLATSLRYGTSRKLSYVGSGVPFIRLADLDGVNVDSSGLKFVSAEEAGEEWRSRVKGGDLLISRSGTLGLSILVSRELEGAVFGSYFIRVRFDESVDEGEREFVAFALNTQLGRLQVERLKTGGIQTNLTLSSIGSLVVPKADSAFQDEVVDLVRGAERARRASRRGLQDAKAIVERAVLGD